MRACIFVCRGNGGPISGTSVKNWEGRAILAAYEAGAACAADGYARANGNFGTALMMGGPGILNATGPIGAVSCDRVPVLVGRCR